MEIILLLGLGGLSWLANLALERLLKRRLRTFEAENIYIIPPYFRQPLLLVALVLIPLEIIFPLAWLIRPVNGIGMGLGLGLPGLMLPILAFALAMLWIHYGAVVLAPKGVRRYALIGYHEIPYRDIREIDQNVFFLTPVTLIRGCGEKIRFPRQIQNHPELFMALSDLQMQNGGEIGLQPSEENDSIGFPYAFGISPNRLLWEKVAFFLLIMIFVVLATMGVWIQLAQEMLPPFTLESFFLIAIFFVPFGIVFPVLVVIVYRQTIDPDQPIRFVLHPDRIDVFFPHNRQECYAVSDLQSVWLNPIQSTLKSEFGGVHVSERVTHYELMINFTEKEPFKLTPNRLAMFKQTPEHLRRVFKELYGI